MGINEYALEAITRSRLNEMRAEAARRAALSPAGAPRRGMWALLRSLLGRTRDQSGRRGIVRPRHA
ncbi:MAG TPA: hypothetical protein VEL75_18085 [Candidatus Methylomirabilis sp.]|nr:hypothetical protein [Candidatus Methylomirabilis sp.]